MHNYPKVTIGVCVRNCENTVPKAIESIVQQKYPHELMEIIFVDDASIDKTLSIIIEYSSKINIPTKIFRNEKWKGLGPARNIVVYEATGKYIIWVDGDMMLNKNFVKDQVFFMENHPKVGIAKGCYGLNFRGKIVSDLQNLEFFTVNYLNYEIGDVPLGTGGAIYRVEAIRKVGGFDEQIHGACEDVDMEYKIKKAGWILSRTRAVFYEQFKASWKELWREYFWQGQGAAYLMKKRTIISRRLLWPPILLFAVIFRSVKAYKLTGRTTSFLLPIHYIYKRTAWFSGFLKAYLK